jgi:hypothetical protein
MANSSFKIKRSLNLEPNASPTQDQDGDLAIDSSDNKLKARLNSTTHSVVTEAQTQTLTNKTIDADSNTITNIENADIKSAAAIDATKIANGSVSNTEFQYLDGVTSAIQTQINTKLTNPLTTNGDIVYYSNSAAQRLAVGTNGQILTLASGYPSWASPSYPAQGFYCAVTSNEASSTSTSHATVNNSALGTKNTFGGATASGTANNFDMVVTLAAGTYEFIANISARADGINLACVRIYDGTNVIAENFLPSLSGAGIGTISGVYTYGSTQTSITISVQYHGTSGSTVRALGGGSGVLYCTPSLVVKRIY